MDEGSVFNLRILPYGQLFLTTDDLKKRQKKKKL